MLMGVFTNAFLTIVLLLLQTPSINGFITQRDCPAPSKCACYSYFISCANRHLTSVPPFGSSYWTKDKLSLSFPGNELTTLQAYAFRGLRFRHHTTVDLSLNMNHLHTIEQNAFSGIADKVISINLNDNNLTSIPTELSTLTQLQELLILRNPISSLDDTAVASLGTHLKSFEISMKYFTTWPNEMHHLSKLEELSISNVHFQYLDQNAFIGMNSLTKVTIDNSSLVSVPVTLTKLPLLESFTISRSKRLSLSESLIKPCIGDTLNSTSSSNLTEIDAPSNDINEQQCLIMTPTIVEISHNTLRYIDDIYSIFPSVTNLSLAHNNISFIYSDDVKENMSLVSLDISHNNLTRIPSALNKVTSLLSLDFQYNRIVSVEEFDIFRLINLQVLILAHNPLEYIAPNVFESNPMLKIIRLSDTQLRYLPVSLSGLTNLQALSLPYETIECTCRMSPLKQWNVTSVTLSGYCKDKKVPIKDFIEKSFPNCK